VTYDDYITLIKQEPQLDSNGLPITDDIGNQLFLVNETVVYCALSSVMRSEFYNAAAAGLRPEIVFVVHGFEYTGAQQVRFDGKLYNVIRTYAKGFEEIELTCERVAADEYSD